MQLIKIDKSKFLLNVVSFDQCLQLNCVSCTGVTWVYFDLILQLFLYVDQFRSMRVLLMLFDICVLLVGQDSLVLSSTTLIYKYTGTARAPAVPSLRPCVYAGKTTQAYFSN